MVDTDIFNLNSNPEGTQDHERMWRLILTVACEEGMCYDPRAFLSGYALSQLQYFMHSREVSAT